MLDTIKSDIERNAAALSTTSILDSQDVKKYLADVVWPMLEAIVEGIGEELEGQAETIDEIISEEEDLIHGELAAMIIGTLSEGAEVIRMLLAKLPASDKSAGTMSLRARATAFGGAVQDVIGRVTDVTVPDDEPEVDDPEADGDDDDDADDDGKEGDDAGH